MEWVTKQSQIAVSILILCVFVCLGCASRALELEKARNIDTFMDSWVGHYQSELTASWGIPTRVIPDGKGGSVIVYESLKGSWGDETDKRIVGGTHYPAGPRQTGYIAIRRFYVNEKGIIYSWNWSGL
jgi:hypothetical protein